LIKIGETYGFKKKKKHSKDFLKFLLKTKYKVAKKRKKKKKGKKEI